MSLERWREQVERETGRPADRLTRTLPGGIRVEPLHARVTGPGPGPPGGWPYARAARPDPARPLSCPLVLADDPEAPRQIADAAADGARVFWVDGIAAPEEAPAAIRDALARAEAEDVAGVDPLGDVVRHGAPRRPLEDLLGDVVRGTGRAGGPPAVASGLPYDSAGADPVQQLAFALATGALYLRRELEAGAEAEAAADRVHFRLAVGGDVLVSVSMLRAMRVLWARVRTACGAPGPVTRLHAVSSERELTRRDPWVNMLRGTTHAFAALAGGADLVTVLPWDRPLRPPTRATRRLALHTPTILVEECQLASVIDPAGGAGAFEDLTDRLARAAWGLFREIEAEGGMCDALLSGSVRRRVDEAWATRAQAVATRRRPITGVSEFANPGEEAPEGALPLRPPRPDSENLPFPRRHDAESFERLRDRADELADGPGRPRVFLANLGPPAEHRARTGFAANFFRAGGFDVVESPGAGDVPAADAASALADAFRAAGTTLVCLCGTDERYAEAAAPVAEALRRAGADRVALAGPPAGREELADDFLFLGCDAPRLLGELLDRFAGEVAR
jgi:methylmalonyl-CoA mutase